MMDHKERTIWDVLDRWLGPLYPMKYRRFLTLQWINVAVFLIFAFNLIFLSLLRSAVELVAPLKLHNPSVLYSCLAGT
jgi:hypothetical protein